MPPLRPGAIPPPRFATHERTRSRNRTERMGPPNEPRGGTDPFRSGTDPRSPRERRASLSLVETERRPSRNERIRSGGSPSLPFRTGTPARSSPLPPERGEVSIVAHRIPSRPSHRYLSPVEGWTEPEERREAFPPDRARDVDARGSRTRVGKEREHDGVPGRIGCAGDGRDHLGADDAGGSGWCEERVVVRSWPPGFVRGSHEGTKA